MQDESNVRRADEAEASFLKQSFGPHMIPHANAFLPVIKEMHVLLSERAQVGGGDDMRNGPQASIQFDERLAGVKCPREIYRAARALMWVFQAELDERRVGDGQVQRRFVL